MGKRQHKDYRKIRVQVWFYNLLRVAGVEGYKGLDEKLGISGEKIWLRYQHGKHVPQPDLLKQVEDVYPGTSSILRNGPCRLFEVLEVSRVQDAVESLRFVLDSFFEGQEIQITETPFLYENPSPASWLHEAGYLLIDDGASYGMTDDFIYPLALAIGHSASRFIGDPLPLAEYIFECLEYFQSRYHIDVDLWAFDQDIAVAAKSARAHLRLAALEKGVRLPRTESLSTDDEAPLKGLFELWTRDRQAFLDAGTKLGQYETGNE